MKLVRTESTHRYFQDLISALDRELRARYGSAQGERDGDNDVERVSTVVPAYLGEEPVGCGCFKKYDVATVEIKRMFVRGPYRGLGIAGTILGELESWAATLGFSRAILETGLAQPEALGLYAKHHYRRMANYGQYQNRPGSTAWKKSDVNGIGTEGLGLKRGKGQSDQVFGGYGRAAASPLGFTWRVRPSTLVITAS